MINNQIKNEIVDCLKMINGIIQQSEQLQKISHLVEIKASIVGGAIRDLILDKPIKDIDVAISLNFHKNLKVIYSQRAYTYSAYKDDMVDEQLQECADEAHALRQRQIEILQLLQTNKFSNIHDKLKNSCTSINTVNAVDAVIALIEQVIKESNKYEVKTVFDNTTLPTEKLTIEDSAYKSTNGLHAVIGLAEKNTNYPIELLFTTDQPENFVKVFDFNICKAFMVENKQGNIEIMQTTEFIEDVNNKKITYTPFNILTQEKIEKSLLVRYSRLYKKFPDYELSTDFKNASISNEMKENIKESINTINLYHKIQLQTEKKPTKELKSNKI